VSVVALPMGPLALLLETDGDPVHLAARVRETLGTVGDSVADVVPAARTVLVVAHDRVTVARLRDLVESGALTVLGAPATPAADTTVVEVAVRYDGRDLGEVAERTGLDPDEVVHRHTAATYRVAFCGFAPGFAYLEGLDDILRLPRRPSPRTRVPAGAVAIAAGYTAVYPNESPGGWHLIGTTDVAVWDPHRSPPALLSPGARVRFVETPS
jgi:KipI family sensor histidine kinase inhibitor